jgi:hypothetical protein
MNQIPNMGDPSTFISFAFVCDGEVAYIINIPPQNEHFLSVMQSNPTIVQFDKLVHVALGDLYKDGKFIKQ